MAARCSHEPVERLLFWRIRFVDSALLIRYGDWFTCFLVNLISLLFSPAQSAVRHSSTSGQSGFPFTVKFEKFAFQLLVRLICLLLDRRRRERFAWRLSVGRGAALSQRAARHWAVGMRRLLHWRPHRADGSALCRCKVPDGAGEIVRLICLHVKPKRSPKFLIAVRLFVRLGEYDTEKETDCVVVDGQQDCADPPLDFSVSCKANETVSRQLWPMTCRSFQRCWFTHSAATRLKSSTSRC